MKAHMKVWIGRRTAVEPARIVCLISDINYTEVHYSDGSMVVLPYTLKKVNGAIEAFGTFVRVNRQSVVNWMYVRCYDHKYIQLKTKDRLLISRRRFKLIDARIASF